MERKIKILVVEDEALTALYLARNLRARGYDVLDPVATGEEAVEAAGSQLPDVIIMDVHLAGQMDGIEAATKIHERWGTAIIFATGYSVDQMQERMKAINPTACLLKPIDSDDLTKFIEAAARKPRAKAAQDGP